jgi:hypothetical protein
MWICAIDRTAILTVPERAPSRGIEIFHTFCLPVYVIIKIFLSVVPTYLYVQVYVRSDRTRFMTMLF